ncbi:MAG: pyridoxamine 5'-phosphate oxidase [Actinomycetota bacterium]
MDTIQEARTRSGLIWTVVGVLITANGVWAFFAPHSFYDTLATYPPYNRHLFHDIGAFSIGLGLAFLIAMRVRSALTVAIAANAVAAVMHAISHIIDRDLGGKASDPWLLSAVGLALAIPAIRRLRGAR